LANSDRFSPSYENSGEISQTCSSVKVSIYPCVRPQRSITTDNLVARSIDKRDASGTKVAAVECIVVAADLLHGVLACSMSVRPAMHASSRPVAFLRGENSAVRSTSRTLSDSANGNTSNTNFSILMPAEFR
jgi:hypothetical protein